MLAELCEAFHDPEPATAAAALRLKNALRQDQRLAAVEDQPYLTVSALHTWRWATTQGAWSKLTKREQEEWMTKFEKALSALFQLFDSSPTPIQSFGFPVRDYALLEAARKMGLDVPEAKAVDDVEDDLPAFTATLRLNRAADATGYTLVHALQHYQDQVVADAENSQRLKKPGDAKAPRALFLVDFQNIHPDVSVAQVAAIATALFDEEVDERKVREMRRTDS